MLNIYIDFKCMSCKFEFILLSEEVDKMPQGRYITCPYCNSKRILKRKSTDDLRECMTERSYKRVRGALRQK